MKTPPLDIHGKPYSRIMFVIILMIGTFCTVLNQTLLATAYPTLMHDFNITTATVQWLTTGFLLVNGIMIPITAFLINKVPSKWIYIFSMTIFLIGTTLCYIAPTFSVLLIGRLVQAVGVGVVMPVLQTIMLSIFPKNKRGAAMGMVGIVIGLAPALGPTLSGWIVDNATWRDLFGMLIPIVAVTVLLSFFFAKSVLPISNPKFDLLSVILSTFGFGALLYGFSEVGNESWTSPKVLISLFAGIILIFFFSKRQLSMKEPFLQLRVFSSKVFSLTTILSGIANMAMIGAEMVLPIYIQEIRGESAFHSGLMLLPGALVLGLMMPVSGRIFDKYGAKRLAIAGMLILSVGTFPFIFLTKSTSILMIMVLYGVRMFGISLMMMPVTTAGMNTLPKELIGDGTAVNNTFRQVASSVGTAILVSIMSNVTKQHLPQHTLLKTDPLQYQQDSLSAALSGYHAAFTVAVVFGIAGFIVAFFLKRKFEEVQA